MAVAHHFHMAHVSISGCLLHVILNKAPVILSGIDNIIKTDSSTLFVDFVTVVFHNIFDFGGYGGEASEWTQFAHLATCRSTDRQPRRSC